MQIAAPISAQHADPALLMTARWQCIEAAVRWSGRASERLCGWQCAVRWGGSVLGCGQAKRIRTALTVSALRAAKRFQGTIHLRGSVGPTEPIRHFLTSIRARPEPTLVAQSTV